MSRAELRAWLQEGAWEHEVDGKTLRWVVVQADQVVELLDALDAHDNEIAAAEQRGREDNSNHGQCYVNGSVALEALLAEARAGRA